MTLLELHQLQYVITVAKKHSFHQAAMEISVTPPTITQQIKKLEDELDLKLFERTTRSVELTTAGEEFVAKAEKILAAVSELSMDMKKYLASDNSNLLIGNNPAIGSFGVTKLIALFQKAYPNITLTFRQAECLDMFSLLNNGDIDVAFLTAFDKLKGGRVSVNAYPLINDELVLVCNKSHPFAAQTFINLNEAKKESFISFPKSSGIYIETIDACQKSGFKPSITYYASSIDTCLGMVAAGMGLLLLSSKTAINHHRSDLAIVRFKPTTIRTLYLTVPNKPDLPSVVTNFKDFCLKWAQQKSVSNGS